MVNQWWSEYESQVTRVLFHGQVNSRSQLTAVGMGKSCSLSLDLVAWRNSLLTPALLAGPDYNLVLLTRTVCNYLAYCRGSFLPVKWTVLVKTKIFVIVEIEKGKHDFISVPDAKCYVCLFHLWWFCKLIQWVAAEQSPHAFTVHLTYSRCDAWLTVHLTVSSRLPRKILMSFWLSLIFDCFLAELLYHWIQMSAQTGLRDGTGLCG